MGTSHRHKPGSIGEPNWGKASSSLTKISKALEELNELEYKPQQIVEQRKIQKRQSILSKRIATNYHHAVRNLVRAAGGRKLVATGGSKALGKAGIAWAISWSQAMQEISDQGLSAWLEKRGISSLEGKTCTQILSLIGEYIRGNIVGFDATAAQEATSYVLDQIEKISAGETVKLEDSIKQLLETQQIKDLIDQFFGVYIYSHLSQNFYEKLEKDKGTETINQTMSEIKDLIMDDVRRGFNGRSIEKINWNSPEAATYISNEFERMINIFTDNED